MIDKGTDGSVKIENYSSANKHRLINFSKKCPAPYSVDPRVRTCIKLTLFRFFLLCKAFLFWIIQKDTCVDHKLGGTLIPPLAFLWATSESSITVIPRFHSRKHHDPALFFFLFRDCISLIQTVYIYTYKRVCMYMHFLLFCSLFRKKSPK